MRTPKVLAIINALAAATVLIVVVTVTDVSWVRISPATVVEASKDKAPEFGLQLLAKGVEDWQHRSAVLKWVCYGTLPVLLANVLCWAGRHREPPAH